MVADDKILEYNKEFEDKIDEEIMEVG